MVIFSNTDVDHLEILYLDKIEKMKIALVKYASIDVETKLRFINPLSDDLGSFFAEKDYGQDVKEIVIGVICVSKSFEPFFKIKKPRYTKDKRVVKSKDTKKEYEIEKLFEYDIRLEHAPIVVASDEEIVKIISSEIINSLDIIDEMKHKIKDFNLTKFKNDLKLFFNEWK